MKICGLFVFLAIAAHNAAGEFGLRQSPIDIVTKNLNMGILPPLQWGSGYFELPDKMDVWCDGHSIIVSTQQHDVPTLSGGSLSGVYRFHSLHFHWGSTNNVGSEHTIDGKTYSMEMHIVHTKENLTMEESRRIPDGIAVIGYMIYVARNDEDIELNRNVEAFKILTKSMDSIKKVDEKVQMVERFPLKNLVVPFCSDYATYAGSLTSDPFSEAVVWILSPYELVISEVEIKEFRSLTARNLMTANDNFRHTQPLNGRIVYYDMGDSTAQLEYLKQKYYQDKYSQPSENNIFKNGLFANSKYHFSRDVDKYSKQPQIYLNDDRAYFFDTKISLIGDKTQYLDVVVANFQEKKYPIYYRKKLTYGVDLMGLMGVAHVPYTTRQDTITSLLADLNHVFLIYEMNLNYLRTQKDIFDLYGRITHTVDGFCTRH